MCMLRNHCDRLWKVLALKKVLICLEDKYPIPHEEICFLPGLQPSCNIYSKSNRFFWALAHIGCQPILGVCYNPRPRALAKLRAVSPRILCNNPASETVKSAAPGHCKGTQEASLEQWRSCGKAWSERSKFPWERPQFFHTVWEWCSYKRICNPFFQGKNFWELYWSF